MNYTKGISKIFLMFMVLVMFSACAPPKLDKYVEIAPNETAYVIPVEDEPAGQQKFASEEYLEEKKVGAKRIYLTQRKLKTGRWWFNRVWVPTIKVIRVDRKPIRLIWGENDKIGGIRVESRDSIGFTVGIDITAHIDEANTSKFLYNFPVGDLNKVLSDAVKSKATEILGREFAKYDLEGTAEVVNHKGEVIKEAVAGARERKGEIVSIAKEELIAHFEKRGVTIDTFGLVGGLDYDNVEIQNAINRNFESALDIENRRNERLAQEETNQKMIDKANAEQESAKKFALAQESRTAQVRLEIEKMNAEARLKWADSWDGKLPTNMLPDGSNMLMQMQQK
jgi:hypothetical protein